MAAWLTGPQGDPGRIHVEGMTARVALEEARDEVASMLGARSREIVFTSGATESIAAAAWGALERGNHVVAPAVEHSAVRECSAGFAEALGGSVTVVGVDRTGRVDPDRVLAALRPDTALVHLQWGNHEVGTLQPVDEVVRACRERGVLVHVDAAQAAGRVPIDLGALAADLVSVSGHKFGAPPGTGVLVVRRGLRVRPLLRGGDQERARRAGMENLPALIGLGAACAALRTRLEQEQSESRRRTQSILDATAELDGVTPYGDPERRLPHIVCLGIADVEPQAVLLGLDRAGIAAHAGSACASATLEPSPVLEAMGVDAHHSLRVSVGWSTTDADVDAFLQALPEVLAGLRALRRRH